MKQFLHWGSIFVAIAFAGYFVWFAVRTLDFVVLLQLLSSPLLLAGVILAVLLYALIIPVTAWAWGILLYRQGESWQSWGLAKILGLTQLSKYVPGNVVQHATRAALSLKSGMSGRALIVTVAQETLLAVAASLLVGFVMLLATPHGVAAHSDVWPEWLLWLGIALGSSVLALASVELPPERLRSHPSRWLRLLSNIGGLPGPVATLSALGAYTANYLLIGLGLWLVSRTADFPVELDYTLVTAAFALSWALGFLAPGAPGGLGVREGIMLLLLHGVAADEILLAFVLLARVVTMLGDALCFSVASVAGARYRRKSGVAR